MNAIKFERVYANVMIVYLIRVLLLCKNPSLLLVIVFISNLQDNVTPEFEFEYE